MDPNILRSIYEHDLSIYASIHLPRSFSLEKPKLPRKSKDLVARKCVVLVCFIILSVLCLICVIRLHFIRTKVKISSTDVIFLCAVRLALKQDGRVRPRVAWRCPGSSAFQLPLKEAPSMKLHPIETDCPKEAEVPMSKSLRNN